MSRIFNVLRGVAVGGGCWAIVSSAFAQAQMLPEWVSNLPIGSSLSSGLQGFAVDAAGNSYVTAITGSSSNSNILTASFDADGALRWQKIFDGPAQWHDQSRGLALGPGGKLWVVGNTPDAMSYANVLALEYDTSNGALLKTAIYSSGPGTSEFGGAVAVDAAGDVYIGGGTVGDGGDGLLLKLDATGAVQWTKTWDGPAWGPFSQDNVLQMRVDPAGDVVALIHGVMNSNHPDYVVRKLAPLDGSTLWEATWGVNGGDYASDMEIDAAGNVYVTGIGINGTDQFSTIKLDGSSGALLWQAYDQNGNDNFAAAIALDGNGGVYVTGSSDPEGDHSNFNDNIYTVKRDATTGAFAWSFAYGLNCVGCYDVSTDVLVDSNGLVYVAGSTSSAPYSGDQITFVLDAATGVEITRGVLSADVGWSAGSGALRFDAAENLYQGANASNPTTGAKELAVVKYLSPVPPTHQLSITPLVGGSTATFTIEHATPISAQILLMGASGTASLPAPSFGVTVGIANPIILLVENADAAGEFVFSAPVPTGFAGVTLWFQAIEFQSETDVVQRTLQ